MAIRKSRITSRSGKDPEPSTFRTVSENGKAPESRLRNASQAFEVAVEIEKSNKKRSGKMGRIYRAYNRFPPTQYSKLAKEGGDWQSNVNFGMLAFVVDNNLASFFDMLTERTQTAEIVTKKGDAKERREWSEYISIGFDQAIQRWDEFLLNQEQGLLDMLLYGKGVEMWEDNDGFMTKHIPADEILVPDSTKINLGNFDVVVVRWKYQLHELYDAIKDEASAEEMGWNVDAVIEAMRWKRDSWRSKTSEEFLKDVKEGNVTLTSHLKENISVFILYVKEFGGKVSKHIVLRDYAPAFSLTRGAIPKMGDKEHDTKINDIGFLFSKTAMFENYKQVFAVFIDNAGSGMWHNTPSLAEKIFVQCRQYDFAMNAIMDAIKINMSLILQGSTAEATEKLKDLVLGPYTILPADVNVAQQRMSLPTGDATNALQFLMLDMNRGIGNYRIHEKGQGGEAPTATQSQLDATEAAKLTGTQLRRFNSQHSIYYRELYRRFVDMKEGEEGYETFKEFKDFMAEKKVPKEAWQFKNIHSIKSTMLAGAGSPSYKLMAAQQTIQLTNISPKDEGQANAVRDAIAALQGRNNVDRYLPREVRPDPTWDEQKIGFENELMESLVLNPQNVMVFPGDNHVQHVTGHLNDMARTLTLVNQSMQGGKFTKEEGQAAMTKMLNMGGHINGHMQFLSRDESKKEMVKEFAGNLAQVQREADQLSQQFAEMQKAQADNATGDLENDPEVRKQLALAQIAIHTKEKLAQIQLGALSQKHSARLELDQERAANSIAITRAQAAEKLEGARKVRKTKQAAAARTA